jgi:beta-glucanase (GH16 family)
MRVAGIRLAISTVVALLLFSTSLTANADPPRGTGLTALIAGLQPTLEDEFDGPEGAQPNPALWNIETGGGGWGNREQQVYTDAPANVRLDGDGHLIMEAREEAGEITSSRLNSYGKATLSDGVFAVRLKLPAGQGIHPAVWMLGSSWRDAGYPDCGEIDVVEIVNDSTEAHFTVHGPWDDRRVPGWQVGTNRPTADLSADFHTYWVHKQSDVVTFGIDESPLVMVHRSDVPSGGEWVQDEPFFALLSLAVGGKWPGALAPGVLPVQMIVDWVRFYA